MTQSIKAPKWKNGMCLRRTKYATCLPLHQTNGRHLIVNFCEFAFKGGAAASELNLFCCVSWICFWGPMAISNRWKFALRQYWAHFSHSRHCHLPPAFLLLPFYASLLPRLPCQHHLQGVDSSQNPDCHHLTKVECPKFKHLKGFKETCFNPSRNLSQCKGQSQLQKKTSGCSK